MGLGILPENQKWGCKKLFGSFPFLFLFLYFPFHSLFLPFVPFYSPPFLPFLSVSSLPLPLLLLFKSIKP